MRLRRTMTGRVLLIAVLAPLAALCLAQPARAQDSAEGNATVQLIKPLSLTKLRDLRFGTIFTNGTQIGSVTINPNAPDGSATSVTGGLVTGGVRHSARFAGAATSSSVINIRVPKKAISITRIGGTETLTVRDFTLQGNDKRVLAAGQYFTFQVGGTLDIPAGAVEGDYEANFEVFIQYP